MCIYFIRIWLLVVYNALQTMCGLANQNTMNEAHAALANLMTSQKNANTSVQGETLLQACLSCGVFKDML